MGSKYKMNEVVDAKGLSSTMELAIGIDLGTGVFEEVGKNIFIRFTIINIMI
jgi:hypothetical protein